MAPRHPPHPAHRSFVDVVTAHPSALASRLHGGIPLPFQLDCAKSVFEGAPVIVFSQMSIEALCIPLRFALIGGGSPPRALIPEADCPD
ncbi:uncharacterized protein M6B38_343495 [Iris pallida]|uniref:Uncharacterized protein n=1 Tax=Iris pallida TaxID=29817 RepID=A0AAX6GTP7_IRIPA|nr:uncharacterized protein M6B38_343495 [Iris pallida]